MRLSHEAEVVRDNYSVPLPYDEDKRNVWILSYRFNVLKSMATAKDINLLIRAVLSEIDPVHYTFLFCALHISVLVTMRTSDTCL